MATVLCMFMMSWYHVGMVTAAPVEGELVEEQPARIVQANQVRSF